MPHRLVGQIAPKDIDQLHLGQKAMLRMTAFNQRVTPELERHVSRAAADITTDRRSGLSFYLAPISVPISERKKLNDAPLVAGMPASAFIKASECTAFSYVAKPLTDRISRTFRKDRAAGRRLPRWRAQGRMPEKPRIAGAHYSK